jgi:enoyl-CoA hydratase
MSDLVLRRIEDGVGVVSLNRPEKHNAINDEMSPEFHEAMAWAIESPDVRCILVRGEGKSFCSGRDTAVLGHRARDESDYLFVRRAQNGRLDQLDAPKPIAADMRVASSDVRMRLPEIHFGILPDTGGTQFLTQLIGPSKAKYYAMTGDVIDGEQALAWGIVDWLVEPDALDAKALEIAKKIAAGPPLAVAMAKQLVDQFHGETVRRGIGAELLAQTTLFKSEDYQEARAALREKRAPKYKGK